MTNTLSQIHFNAIIYYASEVFKMKMMVESADRYCKTCQKDVDDHLVTTDSLYMYQNSKAIRPETHRAGKDLAVAINLTLKKSHDYHLNVERDRIAAQTQLDTYLNNFADDRIRWQIDQLIKQTEPSIQTIHFDGSPYWINHDAVESFIRQLGAALNNKYGHEYEYKQPPSNHFLISFLSHPFIRGVNSLILAGGLLSTTIGVIAATGLITGLAPTVVVAMIAGGIVASVSGIGLLTASFFRHRSPEELAARQEKMTTSDMDDAEDNSPVIESDHPQIAANADGQNSSQAADDSGVDSGIEESPMSSLTG